MLLKRVSPAGMDRLETLTQQYGAAAIIGHMFGFGQRVKRNVTAVGLPLSADSLMACPLWSTTSNSR